MKENSYLLGGAAAGAVGVALFSALIQPITGALHDVDMTFFTILYSAPVTAFLLFSKRIGPVGAVVQTLSITAAHFLAVHAAIQVYDMGKTPSSGILGGDSQMVWQAGAVGGAIGSVLSFAAMAMLAPALRTRGQLMRYGVFTALLIAMGAAGVWLYEDRGLPLEFVVFIPWQAVFSVAIILAFREAKTA